MILRLGSAGPAVRRLQEQLAARGFDVGAPRGSFDMRVRAAVILFQQGHLDPNGRPLEVDGVVGDETSWALEQPPEPPAALAPSLPEALPAPRAAILRVARGELERRVVEVPFGSNGGPRVDLYTGGRRTAWCAYFASWVIREALAGRPAFPPRDELAAVASIWDWAARTGRRVVEPQPGDLFIMLHKDAAGVDPGHGHTGFVVAVEGDEVVTTEGNCANGVRSRRRPLASIRGFVCVV